MGEWMRISKAKSVVLLPSARGRKTERGKRKKGGQLASLIPSDGRPAGQPSMRRERYANAMEKKKRKIEGDGGRSDGSNFSYMISHTCIVHSVQ